MIRNDPKSIRGFLTPVVISMTLLEIENYQISVEESLYQINIDITYIQPIEEEDNNEYISDEDFTEFEQTNNQEWNNLEDSVPIRWYNDFERLNLDKINSTDHIYDTTD